ncbi:MAG TPA: tetratricopeptide repeat protein [Candidatus Binataceae bacterium]|jgi:Tetratrico peptide repeat|nr:tetratricopeptide repeat protein [Candidatus Binataceae bacterium]
MKRRSRAVLEAEVDRAKSPDKKATALYRLALFHDNNTRESDAIPLYEKALEAGLDTALKAKALAWLASSLYKTGEPRRAMMRVKQSRAIAQRTKTTLLQKFLDGLEARIARSLARKL